MSEYFVGQIVKNSNKYMCEHCRFNLGYGVIVNVDDSENPHVATSEGYIDLFSPCWTISDKQVGDFNEDYYQPGMKIFAVNPQDIHADFENGEVVEVVKRYMNNQFAVKNNDEVWMLNPRHMFPVHPQQQTTKEYRVETIIIQLNGYINRVNVVYNQDSETCLIRNNILQTGVELETLARLENLLNTHVHKTIEYGLFYTRILYHVNTADNSTSSIQNELQDFIDQYLDDERVPF